MVKIINHKDTRRKKSYVNPIDIGFEDYGHKKNFHIDKKAKKKVLITGANSYIGESFEKWAKKHYPILAVDTLDMKENGWYTYDFSPYDIIFHVAGIAHSDDGRENENTARKYYEVNTDLAIKTAQLAKSAGIKQFILMSSMIVYGEAASYGKSKIIDEYTIPVPKNAYGDSKWRADKAIRELGSEEFKTAVLRAPMIYGKGSKGNYPILSKLARTLPIFPDIYNERSMIHIDNLCEFVCLLMLSGEGGVYHPQNKEYSTTSNIVEEINKISGRQIRLTKLFNPIIAIAFHVPGKVSNLLKKAFGNMVYSQKISHYEGLDYHINDFKTSITLTEGQTAEKHRSIREQLKQFVPSDKAIHVFIIGLRGYTQNYGGWESFAQGLLNHWNDDNIQWWAYEKVSSFEEEEIVIVSNIVCIRVCEMEKSSLTMMKYDKHCTDLTCEYVKERNISYPIMYHLGVRIGPYLWIKRHYIKTLGIKMIENPAGAEWRRTKWNKAVQLYLYISAIMMAKSTDCMICDNEGIRELYKKILYGKKPMLEQISYGVEQMEPVSAVIPEKVKSYFAQWGIEKYDYYLILGRFIPENNYEIMLKGFIKSHTKKKLLIICNYKNEFQSFYRQIKESTGFAMDSRIIMAGTLYDKDILHYIRQYALGYIHGHSVGGTNPGLLEAMSETDINILYHVNFNRYVGGKAAFYFSDENQLANVIENVDHMEGVIRKKLGDLARFRMKKKYSWEKIVQQYQKLLYDITGINGEKE